MKCILCNGMCKEKMVEYKEFAVSLGTFKGRVCKDCGETFFDSETARKIQARSKEKGLFGLAKRTKIAQVGNSLAIRIPKEIAQFMGLKKEKEVRLVPKSPDEMIVESADT